MRNTGFNFDGIVLSVVKRNVPTSSIQIISDPIDQSVMFDYLTKLEKKFAVTDRLERFGIINKYNMQLTLRIAAILCGNSVSCVNVE